MNTKIHAVVDGLGNPVEFLLSPGNNRDFIRAIELLSKIEIKDSNVLGDKAYGTEAIRNYITKQEAAYVIPSKSNNPNSWIVTGGFTRSDIWSNASFRKSSGFAG